MVKNYKARYWNTLIQLEKPEDKVSFQKACKKNKIAPSKVIGMFINDYIFINNSGNKSE